MSKDYIDRDLQDLIAFGEKVAANAEILRLEQEAKDLAEWEAFASSGVSYDGE